MLTPALLLATTVGTVPFSTGEQTAIVAPLAAKRVPVETAEVLVDVVVDVVQTTGGYQVLGPDDVNVVLDREQQRAATDECAQRLCYTDVAEALQADVLISGQVSQLAGDIIVSVAAFDPREQRLLGRGMARRTYVEANYEEAVREAARAMFVEGPAVVPALSAEDSPEVGPTYGVLRIGGDTRLRVNRSGVRVGADVAMTQVEDEVVVFAGDVSVRLRYRVAQGNVYYWMRSSPAARVFHRGVAVGEADRTAGIIADYSGEDVLEFRGAGGRTLLELTLRHELPE